MGAEIPFKRPDGKDARGYLANSASGDAPGVIVIQEWWGLIEQVKAMVDRFALAGLDALAPDLHQGVVVPYHDADRAAKEMASLNFLDAAEQTVRGAVQYLKRNGAKCGIAGYCMGGAVAVIAAAKIPELSAAVSFTGCRPSRRPNPPTSGFRCRAISPTRTTTSRRRWSMSSRKASGPPARTPRSSAMTPTTPSSMNSG